MDDLISRVALRDAVSSVSMPWDFVDAINAIAAINTLIEEAPVVDAVPVEWLKQYAPEKWSTYMQAAVEIIIEAWLEEQEAGE